MNQLVFVDWYTKTAIYRDGKLVYFGSFGANFDMLRALGFECVSRAYIPTQDIPPEFDRDETGRWKPPMLLTDLERQQAAVQERERLERIRYLREQLERLEGGA